MLILLLAGIPNLDRVRHPPQECFDDQVGGSEIRGEQDDRIEGDLEGPATGQIEAVDSPFQGDNQAIQKIGG